MASKYLCRLRSPPNRLCVRIVSPSSPMLIALGKVQGLVQHKVHSQKLATLYFVKSTTALLPTGTVHQPFTCFRHYKKLMAMLRETWLSLIMLEWA